ncbi:hypothetical protein [Methylomicrobium sp. Wu6]|uniref:hypothetical protein n=1 Tax=Methylomicrobium sp. Wu6 TaxID=3107928 RepID=UPI002DD65940|nr:hypothetical protein [Methylomicrobium sp. Wu6]MEC4749811.1 hypothetical protein [Methylomicrobium sp. Wu6]
MTNHIPSIPPVGSNPIDNNDKSNERLFRTSLAPRDYLRLEIEAMDRGLKPFGLTKAVMTLYLHKQLVNVRELPPDIQSQIVQFFKDKKSAIALKED